MTSLQPREQGRARALSPLGCHCAADFQEALGPRRGWLGPLGGAGLLAGLPLPPPGWASRHTRGRIVPTAVPGPESTSGHCACAHKGVGGGVRRCPPAVQGSVAAPPPFAGPRPCRSRWERRTSEATGSPLFFFATPCLSPPTGGPVHLDPPQLSKAQPFPRVPSRGTTEVVGSVSLPSYCAERETEARR